MLNPKKRNADLKAHLKSTCYRDYCIMKEWSRGNNENFILAWEHFPVIPLTSYTEEPTITNN